jgi:predicted GNAT superfamily acetyltransferase
MLIFTFDESCKYLGRNFCYKWVRILITRSAIRDRSHITSAARGGGGGLEMLTVADRGGGGFEPC